MLTLDQVEKKRKDPRTQGRDNHDIYQCKVKTPQGMLEARLLSWLEYPSLGTITLLQLLFGSSWKENTFLS